MTRKLGWSKLRSERTFIDFRLQYKLELDLEDRCIVKKRCTDPGAFLPQRDGCKR